MTDAAATTDRPIIPAVACAWALCCRSPSPRHGDGSPCNAHSAASPTHAPSSPNSLISSAGRRFEPPPAWIVCRVCRGRVYAHIRHIHVRKTWPHRYCRAAHALTRRAMRRAMRRAISPAIYTSERDRRMATLRAHVVINRPIADQSPGDVPQTCRAGVAGSLDHPTIRRSSARDTLVARAASDARARRYARA